MEAGRAPRPSRPPRPRRGQGWPPSPRVEGGPARTSAPDRRAAVGRVRTGSSLDRLRVLRPAPVAAPSKPTGSGPDGAAERFPRHGPGLPAPRCPKRCVRCGSPWRGGAGSANQDDQLVRRRWQEALRSSCPRFCGGAPIRENPPSGTSSRDSRPPAPTGRSFGDSGTGSQVGSSRRS